MVPSSLDSFEKSKLWKSGCFLNSLYKQFLLKSLTRRPSHTFLGYFYRNLQKILTKFKISQYDKNLLQTVTDITKCDKTLLPTVTIMIIITRWNVTTVKPPSKKKKIFPIQWITAISGIITNQNRKSRKRA